MSAVSIPSAVKTVKTPSKSKAKTVKAVKTVAKKTSKSKANNSSGTVTIDAKKTLANASKSAATAVSNRRAVEANKDKATQAKRKTAKANAVTIEPKRTFGIDDERIAELKKEKAYNAYREGSSYWLVVESLHSLGIGKYHSTDAIIAEYVKQADKDALKNFKSKEPRNADTAQDWKGKIRTNCYVVTRKDYGEKMRQIGYEVRYEKTDEGHEYGLFKLNGKSK